MTERSADRAALQRIEALITLKRYPEAASQLATVLGAEPDNGAVVISYARVLNYLGKTDLAIEMARRGVALQPESESSHRVLAEVLIDAGRSQEAVAAAYKAVERGPHFWASHYTLGRALRVGHEPRHAAALMSARKAVELAPHSAQAHNLVGLCLQDLNLTNEARAAYQDALRLDPQDALVLANVANLKLGSGRLASAATSLTSGLSADAQQEVLHRLYDALIIRLIRRIYVTELVFGVVTVCLALARAPYAARAATGLFMVLALALGSWSILRRLPKGASSYTLSVTRRHRGAVGLLVVLAAAIGTFVVVMSVGPSAFALSILSVFKFGAIPAVLVIRLLLAPLRSPMQRSQRPPNLRSRSLWENDE